MGITIEYDDIANAEYMFISTGATNGVRFVENV